MEEDEDYKDNPVVFPPREAYAGQETYRYLGERKISITTISGAR